MNLVNILSSKIAEQGNVVMCRPYIGVIEQCRNHWNFIHEMFFQRFIHSIIKGHSQWVLGSKPNGISSYLLYFWFFRVISRIHVKISPSQENTIIIRTMRYSFCKCKNCSSQFNSLTQLPSMKCYATWFLNRNLPNKIYKKHYHATKSSLQRIIIFQSSMAIPEY